MNKIKAKELYNSLNSEEKVKSIIDTLLSMEEFSENYLKINALPTDFSVGDIVTLKTDQSYSKEELSYRFNYYTAKRTIYVVIRNNIKDVDVARFELQDNKYNYTPYVEEYNYGEEEEHSELYQLNRKDLVKIDHKKAFEVEYFEFFENGKQRKHPDKCHTLIDQTGQFTNIKSVKEVKTDDSNIKALLSRVIK